MIPQQKKRKMNPLLMKVIVISVGIHVIAGVIAGVITVANIVIQEDAQFEEPPAVEEVEPPKEVKVEIKPQKASQMQPMRNLRMRPVSNIAVANVDVDLPSMSDSFTVSAGLGGMGGGSLLGSTRGSIGMGMSDISVFGLKSKAERVLFLIDASANMLTDEKGGLNSYQVIKDEITDMVGGLSAGTLFNVAMYDNGRVDFFSPALRSAGASSHQALITWISAINRSVDQVGLPRGRAKSIGSLLKVSADDELFPVFQRDRWAAGLTHLALEQRVDAVFIISGNLTGFGRMVGSRPLTERETAERERLFASPDYIAQKAAYQAEMTEVKKRVGASEKRENAARAKKGQPAKVWGSGGASSIENKARYFKIKMNVKRPPTGPTGRYSVDSDQIRKYFRALKDLLYDVSSKSGPSVNVVLFLAGNEDFSSQKEDDLQAYTRFFDGRHRVIRGLNEIRAAASARSEES